MSKIKSGLLGGFSGQIGSVIGCRNKGKNILRSKQGKSKILTNQTRSANSLKLAELVLAKGFFESSLKRFMSSVNPQQDFNWNNFVKSLLVNNDFNTKFYLVPYLSYTNQFEFPLIFSKGILPFNTAIKQQVVSLQQVKLNYPDIVIKHGVYDSISNNIQHFSAIPTGDNFQTGSGSLVAPSGTIYLSYMYAFSPSKGKISNIAWAMRKIL